MVGQLLSAELTFYRRSLEQVANCSERSSACHRQCILEVFCIKLDDAALDGQLAKVSLVGVVPKEGQKL